jgi:hypothetical protein
MDIQKYLDELVDLDKKNAYGFTFKSRNNWGNHLGLLYLSLELTRINNVIELGCGDYSTPYLRKYCLKNNRGFETFDNDPQWGKRSGAVVVGNWEVTQKRWLYPCSVAFIDHAPGEHRAIAAHLFSPLAKIVVVHDTELNGAGDYKIEPVLAGFKYRLNYNLTGGGAGATAVSNYIDLNKYRGLRLGYYIFDNA